MPKNTSKSVALAIACVSILASHLLSRAQSAQKAPAKPCVACMQIRVGLPRVVRGPSLEIADNHFSEIQLPNGQFRGFDAHAQTRAIDGKQPWDMGGAARIVLLPGKAGEVDACGQWLNHAELAGKLTLGFIHDETACHYQDNNQTHKSMAFATSADYGITWQPGGQIITGADAPAAGHETGEGDCTVVNGQDGFFYAYCIRARNRALLAARAPVASPGPGNWKKFYEGKWEQPGLGGNATRLGNGSGASVARWQTTGDSLFTGFVPGGVGLFVSSDHTTLTPLSQPILPLDPPGKVANQTDRLLYMVLLDAHTGSNQLSNTWSMVYAYWPANEARDQKYLVFRDIQVSVTDHAVAPQAAILLARWYNPALKDRWSTTAPVPGNYTSYKLDSQSGYLLTVAPSEPSVELEDCVSQRPGHPDHLLAENGFCTSRGYQRLRTAGWIYAKPKPETMPLYRCYDAKMQSHFASNAPNCEGLGSPEHLLGYALAK